MTIGCILIVRSVIYTIKQYRIISDSDAAFHTIGIHGEAVRMKNRSCKTSIVKEQRINTPYIVFFTALGIRSINRLHYVRLTECLRYLVFGHDRSHADTIDVLCIGRCGSKHTYSHDY